MPATGILTTCWKPARPARNASSRQSHFTRGISWRGFPCETALPSTNGSWSKRECYRQNARRALASLSACHERQGQAAEALQAARRLVALDPFDDTACQNLLRLLVTYGQRSEALAHYESFRSSLRTELDLAPHTETTALYERIRLQKGEGQPRLLAAITCPPRSRP